MSKLNDREALEAQLDDLATGQLGSLAAWRLRRRIAHDPQLALVWRKVQQLRTDLAALAPHQHTAQPAFAHRAKTFTLGGLTVKTRTAMLAAGGLMFASVSGALAAHYLARPDLDCKIGVNDVTRKDWWWIHGNFRGNIVLQTPAGKHLYALPWPGSSPDKPVTIRYMLDKQTVASSVLTSMGKHAIQNSQGKVIAYAILSPFSPKDVQKLASDRDEVARDFLDYYENRERVTPSDRKRGFRVVESVPGMVGGHFCRDFVHRKEMMSVEIGSSWKVYGAVRVKAVFYDTARIVNWPGDTTTDAGTGKNLRDNSFEITLPAQKIIEQGISREMPSADELAELSPTEQENMAKMATPRQVPETCWTIADPEFGLDYQTGMWKHVLKSGTFIGYGHHVVRDDRGKPLMEFDVSPLTPTKTAR